MVSYTNFNFDLISLILSQVINEIFKEGSRFLTMPIGNEIFSK